MSFGSLLRTRERPDLTLYPELSSRASCGTRRSPYEPLRLVVRTPIRDRCTPGESPTRVPSVRPGTDGSTRRLAQTLRPGFGPHRATRWLRDPKVTLQLLSRTGGPHMTWEGFWSPPPATMLVEKIRCGVDGTSRTESSIGGKSVLHRSEVTETQSTVGGLVWFYHG